MLAASPFALDLGHGASAPSVVAKAKRARESVAWPWCGINTTTALAVHVWVDMCEDWSHGVRVVARSRDDVVGVGRQASQPVQSGHTVTTGAGAGD